MSDVTRLLEAMDQSESREGGFGVVCLAEQQEPVRRQVALKIIKPGMDTRQVIARFEAERQALALMDHPNIAKVLDGRVVESQISNLKSQIPGGRPYFVMELVRGTPAYMSPEYGTPTPCDRWVTCKHRPIPFVAWLSRPMPDVWQWECFASVRWASSTCKRAFRLPAYLLGSDHAAAPMVARWHHAVCPYRRGRHPVADWA